MRYKVLIDCRNDATGKAYKPGAYVVAGEDFPADVCENWTEITPPVLAPAPKRKRKTKEADHGGNTGR